MIRTQTSPRTPQIVHATGADAPAIGATLASAFVDDPLVRWFLGGRGDAERRLRPAFDAIARVNLAKREPLVFVAPERDGVAIWQPVDGWKHSPADLLRTLPGSLRSFRARTIRLLRALAAVERVHPEAPHYYLSVLGTRADRQGRGIGSAVLAPLLDRCDDESVPAYLESSNPRNEPFYARHGFVRGDEIALPGGCPPVVPMWREPR